MAFSAAIQGVKKNSDEFIVRSQQKKDQAEKKQEVAAKKAQEEMRILQSKLDVLLAKLNILEAKNNNSSEKELVISQINELQAQIDLLKNNSKGKIQYKKIAIGLVITMVVIYAVVTLIKK